LPLFAKVINFAEDILPLFPEKHNKIIILASSFIPSQTMAGNRWSKVTLCDNCVNSSIYTDPIPSLTDFPSKAEFSPIFPVEFLF